MRPKYARLGIEIPDVNFIPCLRFDEAKRLAAEKYGRPIRDPYDLRGEAYRVCGSSGSF